MELVYEVAGRENPLFDAQGNMVFVSALKNNEYNITSGSRNYVGLALEHEINDVGDVCNVYCTDATELQTRMGYAHGVNLSNRHFRVFRPTMEDIELYLRAAEAYPREALANRKIRMVLETLVAYQIRVLKIPAEEIPAREVALLEKSGSSITRVMELTNVPYYTPEEPNHALVVGPDMSLLNIMNGVDMNALTAEMIAKVDKKRLYTLFSLAASGRDRPYFNKDKSAVEKYLGEWAVAKAPFYLMLGRRLSINSYLETEMGDVEFDELVNDFNEKFPSAFAMITLMRSHFGTASLINNTLPREWANMLGFRSIPADIGNQTKVTQVISKLYGNKEMDDSLSEIYTYRTIKSLMVLSIDPYDYLTMSVNKHGWQSCHRINGGEYSTGPFAYLIDKNTMVAFATNQREYDYVVNGFKWVGNSKRWRQLVHVDLNSSAAIFSREYPSVSEEMRTHIRGMYEERVAEFFNVENSWRYSRRVSKVLNMETAGGYAYDDINRSDAPKFAIFHAQLKAPVSERPDSIVMANRVPCVMCHKEQANVQSASPVCNSCRNVVRKNSILMMHREAARSEDEASSDHDPEEFVPSVRYYDAMHRPVVQDTPFSEFGEFHFDEDDGGGDDGGGDDDGDDDGGDDGGGDGGGGNAFERFLDSLSEPVRRPVSATITDPRTTPRPLTDMGGAWETATANPITTSTTSVTTSAPYDPGRPRRTYRIGTISASDLGRNAEITDWIVPPTNAEQTAENSTADTGDPFSNDTDRTFRF